jgi:hypothetical protein
VPAIAPQPLTLLMAARRHLAEADRWRGTPGGGIELEIAISFTMEAIAQLEVDLTERNRRQLQLDDDSRDDPRI